MLYMLYKYIIYIYSLLNFPQYAENSWSSGIYKKPFVRLIPSYWLVVQPIGCTRTYKNGLNILGTISTMKCLKCLIFFLITKNNFG